MFAMSAEKPLELSLDLLAFLVRFIQSPSAHKAI
jgi:hypothetical protein